MSAWAVTAYFNPGQSRRRLDNYREFRRGLRLPLLTVEWSPGGRFELAESDAERVVRVRGGDLMWQKERLLNVGVAELPDDCTSVAWLDCDVVFPDAGWIGDMLGALEGAALVQLFSQVVHLPAEPPPGRPVKSGARLERAILVRRSLASQQAGHGAAAAPGTCAAVADNQAELDELRRLATRPSSGHAWAARRELLLTHGLYDACVCGVGDMALALAAIGRPGDFVRDYPLSPAQRAHYLEWATPFSNAVRGRVAWLEGTLYHLFHGRMADRQYQTRLARLANAGFDPGRQLHALPGGAWQWATPAEPLATFMQEYFAARREDAA